MFLFGCVSIGYAVHQEKQNIFNMPLVVRQEVTIPALYLHLVGGNHATGQVGNGS
jgi:hypothetical protein